MVSRDLGKGIGKTAEVVGGGINKAGSAIKDAAADNPGGLGVAAGAAGLGALALNKLMKRRRTV